MHGERPGRDPDHLRRVGWFREVLPHNITRPYPWGPKNRRRLCLRASHADGSSATGATCLLPIRIYPISAGVKGGLAGGVAMAILAMIYGVAMYHSVWYPVNLLAGTLYAPLQLLRWKR